MYFKIPHFKTLDSNSNDEKGFEIKICKKKTITKVHTPTNKALVNFKNKMAINLLHVNGLFYFVPTLQQPILMLEFKSILMLKYAFLLYLLPLERI